ncbi:MAG: flagellar filament capping protein FliD [Hydrogenophaga sp.]|nr:flagellar filament capping protein FliD [Hydrogenophaga sp.]
MAISAPGVGSGLDIKGIVSQLMELEKKPLTQLTTQATGFQAKLSAFGQLKSQMANLQDQAAKLANPVNWDGLSFSSSNTAAVSGSVNTATAQASSFSVQVSQLAQAQAAATSVFAEGKTFGAGQLTIDLGSWSGNSFTAGSAAAVNIDITAGDDLADVVAKINASGAGVSATVLKDASGERMVLKSDATGVASAFRLRSSGASDLEDLRYNQAVAGAGMNRTQEALNTLATVNGVSVTSTNNTLTNAVPGVTLNFLQVTSGAVNVKVAQDTATLRGNITGLVQSYNALSAALREMTKYEPGTDTAGTLQGDSTATGLQGALRRLFSDRGPASSSFGRLSDMGLAFQLDGSLKVDEAKLTKALESPQELEDFFSNAAGGLAVRIEAFSKGMLGASGGVASRYTAIQNAIQRNTKDQARLSDKIERTEARLLAQYSRLDGTMASLNALSSYVNQQITSWNSQKSN